MIKIRARNRKCEQSTMTGTHKTRQRLQTKEGTQVRDVKSAYHDLRSQQSYSKNASKKRTNNKEKKQSNQSSNIEDDNPD